MDDFEDDCVWGLADAVPGGGVMDLGRGGVRSRWFSGCKKTGQSYIVSMPQKLHSNWSDSSRLVVRVVNGYVLHCGIWQRIFALCKGFNHYLFERGRTQTISFATSAASISSCSIIPRLSASDPN